MKPSAHQQLPPPRGLGEARTAERRTLLIQEIVRETPSADQSHEAQSRAFPSRKFFAAVGGLVTAAAIATTLIYLQGNRTEHQFAATPVMLTYHLGADQRPAAVLLEDLALASEQQAPFKSGPYRYMKIQTWSLYTSVAQGGTESVLVPSTSEIWRGEDGTGLSRTTSNGDVTSGPVPVDTTKYSTDPKKLASQLAVGHPTANGAAERITAIVDLSLSQAVEPKLQAALLRVLASEKGLVSQGTVTDRVGRQGVALGVDSNFGGLPARYTLIFDPHTGALLDYEEMLTTSAGELNVPIPSVISYNVWMERAVTGEVGVLP